MMRSFPCGARDRVARTWVRIPLGVLKTEFKRTLFYFLKSFQIPFFSLKVAVVVFFYNENFSLNLSPSAEFIYFI